MMEAQISEIKNKLSSNQFGYTQGTKYGILAIFQPRTFPFIPWIPIVVFIYHLLAIFLLTIKIAFKIVDKSKDFSRLMMLVICKTFGIEA